MDRALLFAHSCSSCQPQHHLIFFVLLLYTPSFCLRTKKKQKKQHKQKNRGNKETTPKLRLHESQGNEILLPSFLLLLLHLPLSFTCHSWQRSSLFTLFFISSSDSSDSESLERKMKRGLL
ncbi:hypothetical protein F5H01DRAFT_339547 [Linnemannia elongata]|nr:hypothetical protein F5H01DRAFT_339547 [Linnemannia elongata]